ncbi:MAG TPA: DUF3050 domain-containing protein, partial [Planctomycetota bacterium]|nr:DUF3050 domain-containing protein [Planctomycetota bacterium]
YRLAMSDSGADTAPIDGFLAQLSGKPPEETAPAALSAGARDATGSASAAGTADADDMDSCIARALARRDLPAGVAAFTGESLRIARHGTLIELAATFTWGREDVIPELFTRLADALAERDPRAWGRFRHYLERHIERDGESHRPAAHALMARLCGQDAPAWAAAERAARAALSARLALWEAMHARLVAAQGAEAPSPALRAPAAAATWPPAARAPAAAAAPPSAHGTSAGG